MIRAAEFCWLCELADGMMLMAIDGNGTRNVMWTLDPEMAIRSNAEGRVKLAKALANVGFRKILVG